MIKKLFWPLMMSALLCSFVAQSFTSFVQAEEELAFSHGIALFRAPLKYSADFAHFDWVNPDAPKGGHLDLTDTVQYTSFTPWLPDGIGVNPTAMGLTTVTLLTSSRDITEEPFSMYAGPGAVGVRYPDDISYVDFKLNPKAQFYDGTPVTAEDVKWSFEVQVANNSNIASYYREVGEVEIISKDVIRFNFTSTEPNPELPLIVGQLDIYSKKDWEGHDPSRIRKDPFLGCGPYRIVDYKMGEYITYELVEDWWGKDLPVCKGRYNFKTIKLKVYLDRTIAFEAFKAGEALMWFENTAARWSTQYKGKAFESGEIIKNEFPRKTPHAAQGFYFNLRNSLFRGSGKTTDEDDEEGWLIRRAIELAFPFPEIWKSLLYNQYTRTTSFFGGSPGEASGKPTGRTLEILEGYRGRIPERIFEHPEELEPPTGDSRRNSRKAEMILNKLGWKLNSDGWREKDGKVFEFQILLENDGFERHASYFVDWLKKIGIKASYKIVDSSTYYSLWAKREPGTMDMFVGSPYGGTNPGNEKIAQWGSAEADVNASYNVCGLKHSVVDELANAIKSTKNRAELDALARALDYVLKALKPCVFHWHSAASWVAYRNVFDMPSTTPDTGVEPMTSWWMKPTVED